MKFEKHVFICTNERAGRKKVVRKCSWSGISEVLKKQLKDLGLNKNQAQQPVADVRTWSRNVVYPEGVFYEG
jgi:hypothetical protein